MDMGAFSPFIDSLGPLSGKIIINLKINYNAYILFRSVEGWHYQAMRDILCPNLFMPKNEVGDRKAEKTIEHFVGLHCSW